MNDKVRAKTTEWRDDTINLLKLASKAETPGMALSRTANDVGHVMMVYMPDVTMEHERLAWLQPGQTALISAIDDVADTKAKFVLVTVLRNTASSMNVLGSLPQEHVLPYLTPVRDTFMQIISNQDQAYGDVAVSAARHALQAVAMKEHVLRFIPEGERLAWLTPAFETEIKAIDQTPMTHEPAEFAQSFSTINANVKESLSADDYAAFIKSGLNIMAELAKTGNEQNRPVWKQIRSELAGNNEIIPYLSKEELEQAGYLNFAGKNGKELEKQTEVLLTFLETHQDMAQAFVEPLYNRDHEIVMDFHHETKLYININDDKTWEKMENLRNDHKLLVKTQKDPRLNNNQPA